MSVGHGWEVLGQDSRGRGLPPRERLCLRVLLFHGPCKLRGTCSPWCGRILIYQAQRFT